MDHGHDVAESGGTEQAGAVLSDSGSDRQKRQGGHSHHVSRDKIRSVMTIVTK